MFINTNTFAVAAGYSGTCGDGVKWSLNTSSGILSITGSGNMDDYIWEKAPFYSYRMYIKTIYIYNNILNIGDGAFSECENLTEVYISDGVQKIGNCAFSFCKSLKSITISNNVKEIGYSVFDGCSSLSNVIIGNSVKKIGDSAFRDCVSLTSITIPDSVNIMDGDNYGTFSGCINLKKIYIGSGLEKIDDYSFFGCTNISTITISANNKNLKSENNVAFSIDKLKLIKYPNGSESIDYSVDNGVTELGVHSFSYSNNLRLITIPKTVSKIDYYAFGECSALSDIYYQGSKEDWDNIAISPGNECLTNATIHFNASSPEEPIFVDVKYGSDQFSFGKDISGYVGEDINSLLVYTSKDGNIASLDITSSNPNVVEIGAIQIGVGDYITSENEHKATVPLKLKAEGTSTITITSPEGISESIIMTVSKKPEVKKSIAVFTTEKSLSVKTGENMWLAFGLMNEDTELVEEAWEKMAITVSDPTVVALSDYEETEYGYSLEVIGKKEGSTNLTITDTSSGTSTVITVTVYDNYIRTYSYAIDDIEEFYPNNKYEKDIKTNIYNLNGLYVNNYTCIPNFNGTEFQVSFDVYNSRYYNGAVDIYDADGVWIDCEYIDRYSDITSLRDTGEQLFYLITDTVNKQLLSYQSASFSKKTSINIKIPKGGYFTISNNMAESPGTFFVNAFEILYDTTSDLIDFASSKGTDKTAFDKFYKEATKSFAQNVIDARNESLSGEAKKKAMEVALSSLTSEIKKIQKKFISSETKDLVLNGNEMYSAISSLAENVLNSYGINWKHLYQSATGVAESMFIKFSGPAGIALKGMFGITKGSNKLLMAAQMSRSLDNTYATIYSSIDEGYINSHGVIVNTNGNVDSEAVLQVFKVSDDDTLNVILDGDNPLENYELYNICFVKDDKLVQPNGKVRVHIPIPAGMKGSTCKIYRQEPNESWTILDAHIEGNYLVFETDHFSLYAIIGDTGSFTIDALPNQLQYKEGDTLNTEGLVLNVNGERIYSGFICEPTVLTEIGKQVITVKYGCATAEFTVNIYSGSSYSIGGSLRTFGNTDERVTIKLLQDEEVIASVETNDGLYRIENVLSGTYTLEVSKPNHVTRIYEITVDGEDVTQDVKIHLLGDVNGDGKVNTIDVNKVYAHVRETNQLAGYELKCANVAGTDATVNTVDVNRIYAHVKGTNLLW